MGIVFQSPARRFIDGLSASEVEAGARDLLAGFLSAAEAHTVDLESGAFGPEDAVNRLCHLLVRAPQLPGVSSGVSFAIDKGKDPKSNWSLLLHRGPLPLLELRTIKGRGFDPPRQWEQVLVASGAVHVAWTNGKEYLGAADSIYLLKRRRKLFPQSKGRSTDDAIKSGLRLRQLCRDVWSEKPEATKPYRLSSWKRTQKRFMKSFDDLLVRKVGAEELSQVLAAMGTNLPEWLAASDVG
jgi:hypothetical protein